MKQKPFNSTARIRSDVVMFVGDDVSKVSSVIKHVSRSFGAAFSRTSLSAFRKTQAENSIPDDRSCFERGLFKDEEITSTFCGNKFALSCERDKTRRKILERISSFAGCTRLAWDTFVIPKKPSELMRYECFVIGV